MILKNNNNELHKYSILTDLGNIYYSINGLVELENKQDIEYLKNRGYIEIKEEKKGGKK